MQTLAVPTKNVKVFYAHLYDVSGVLTKVHGTMYFMATESGDVTEIEPEHCPFLMPLGECGLADAAAALDNMHGGAAWIATHRAHEVA
jgi:hypothetical protein